ncbi:glycosyltransferase family 61 protein [Akkermansia glycaniphila]|uniref:glycosyltransferase family 61 protein n=1 Tax=Akkermansia glycaniphila TaxID=1679444 RepID=UPI0009F3156B|nr:glycosyltransferase 61 family protein [Akkermansia glycaniphila]
MLYLLLLSLDKEVADFYTTDIHTISTMPFNHRQYIKQTLIPRLFKCCGGKDLWVEDDLQKYGIEVFSIHAKETVSIPSTQDLNTPDKQILEGFEANFDPAFVLKLDYATHKDCVRKFGTIVLPRGKALHTGINNHVARLGALIPKKPWNIRREDLIVAPWPHTFMSYGDWCMCVMPRVCRALSILTPQEKSMTCVALPYSCGNWSREYMELLGISRDRQIDTLTENFGLSKNGTAVTVNAHSAFWLGPSDINRMRHALIGKRPGPAMGKRALFISRKGSRRLNDEHKLYERIRPYGIEFIDDIPRSVQEQLQLFREASLIIGPHGAGLANALWSTMSPHILEIQSSAWFFPSFRIMSAANQSHYNVLIDRSYGEKLRVEENNNTGNLTVNPERFENAVLQVLGQH